MGSLDAIGFIGVGTMGRGMVQNLSKNNFKILAYNRTSSKIRDLENNNVKIVDSIKETADSDVVVTCLPSDAAVEEAVLSNDGLLKYLDSGKIYVDCSTTSLEMTEKLVNACKEKNIQFMDAPLTGSKLGAESGTMTMMMGGKKELFDKLMPIWNAVGKVHVYCGPETYGQRAKFALNMLQALSLQVYLESLILGMKNGVPIDAMLEIFENSAAKSGIGTFKLPYIRKRDFDAHFMLKLMHKDLKFAENEMKKLNLELPLAKHIREIFEKSLGRGDEDIITIVKELEKHAGLEIK